MQAKIQRQLTVALENYPGRLAAVTKAISKQNINIEALSLLDTIEQGVIRLVTSEPTLCKNLLVQEGFYVIEADVLVVELTNIPGQLLQLTAALAENEFNLEYTYGSTVEIGGKMRLVLKVSDLNRAYQIVAALEEI